MFTLSLPKGHFPDAFLSFRLATFYVVKARQSSLTRRQQPYPESIQTAILITIIF